jgi:hypothetical protein
MSAANSRLRWARLSKPTGPSRSSSSGVVGELRGEVAGFCDRAAVELSGAVGGADEGSDDALHVDLHGLLGEAILEGFGAFDQLAAVKVANPVAVDEGKAEAFGDAQCLGCIGAGVPDHFECGGALGFCRTVLLGGVVERCHDRILYERCYSEARGAGCRPAQPLGCGQKNMGTSGPAQGQGIARRSEDGLRMALPASSGLRQTRACLATRR